ncbi:MAG TPA: hypothetical protein VHY35_21370 [Stellaceae bacterium]|jgi:hypothetical protein|nr:hypothetical protein [Stellaceae bacterium]
MNNRLPLFSILLLATLLAAPLAQAADEPVATAPIPPVPQAAAPAPPSHSLSRHPPSSHRGVSHAAATRHRPKAVAQSRQPVVASKHAAAAPPKRPVRVAAVHKQVRHVHHTMYARAYPPPPYEPPASMPTPSMPTPVMASAGPSMPPPWYVQAYDRPPPPMAAYIFAGPGPGPRRFGRPW